MRDDPSSPATLSEAVTLKQREDALGTAKTLLEPPASSEWDAARSEPAVVNPAPTFAGGDRYERRRLLGQGGMGDVTLSTDRWLGRDIAIKTMRGEPSADDRARFLREACIQGQLEHPSVVPVYDLGAPGAREAFFTMKRVQGHTLREILDRLRAGDASAVDAYPRRKLLSALSQAALAVAFAHARGVVHRDLKPDNVMLGEFGEVYVLDWGIAKTSASGEAATPFVPVTPPPDGTNPTIAGTLVGTPGYMSPEQAQGETHAVTAKSDVYAMGAILFEVLTLEPLNQGGNLHALLMSTIANGGTRPSSRTANRDIPPELDDLCARATIVDPRERLGSMRDFADAITDYLDGERDVERRRELAASHIAAAERALVKAMDGGPEAEASRAEGLRALGRALALDPNERGVELLSRAILHGTDALPPEAEAELKAVELRDRQRAAGRALLVYLAYAVPAVAILALGVRDWPMAITAEVLVLVMFAHTLWMVRTGNTSRIHMRRNMVVNFVVIAMLSMLAGPLVLVPQTAAVSAASFMVGIRANRETVGLIASLAGATFVVPLILEWTGVLPRSFAVEDGVIKIFPRMIDFQPVTTEILLLVGAITAVGMTAFLVGRSTQTLVEAERKNFIQAYRLKQLVPADIGAPQR